MTGAVLVFARAPALGAAKTRLEPALGKENTLALYRAFLADSLDAARASGARVLLAHTAGDVPERALADDAFEQRGATFGARFDHALADARARTSSPREPLVLVGADTPHLGPALLQEALHLLHANEAVLGPSSEGGFYLVGFRGEPVELKKAFDEPNDAAAVARLTRPTLLPPNFDVDVPEDLVNFMLHLETLTAAGASWLPRRSIAALAQMGARVEDATTMGARRRRLVIS